MPLTGLGAREKLNRSPDEACVVRDDRSYALPHSAGSMRATFVKLIALKQNLGIGVLLALAGLRKADEAQNLLCKVKDVLLYTNSALVKENAKTLTKALA